MKDTEKTEQEHLNDEDIFHKAITRRDIIKYVLTYLYILTNPIDISKTFAYKNIYNDCESLKQLYFIKNYDFLVANELQDKICTLNEYSLYIQKFEYSSNSILKFCTECDTSHFFGLVSDARNKEKFETKNNKTNTFKVYKEELNKLYNYKYNITDNEVTCFGKIEPNYYFEYLICYILRHGV